LWTFIPLRNPNGFYKAQTSIRQSESLILWAKTLKSEKKNILGVDKWDRVWVE